tara:strand:- start:931 stop:1113 length:183 start_codon:yes stop_codon:yes gene_type:complete
LASFSSSDEVDPDESVSLEPSSDNSSASSSDDSSEEELYEELEMIIPKSSLDACGVMPKK